MQVGSCEWQEDGPPPLVAVVPVLASRLRRHEVQEGRHASWGRYGSRSFRSRAGQRSVFYAHSTRSDMGCCGKRSQKSSNQTCWVVARVEVTGLHVLQGGGFPRSCGWLRCVVWRYCTQGKTSENEKKKRVDVYTTKKVRNEQEKDCKKILLDFFFVG